MTSKLDQVASGADPGRFRYLFYGEQKIGKSTIAAAAPDSIFIDLEGGLRFITCKRYSWDKNVNLMMAHVEAAIQDLTNNPHEYRHLWIDGLEILEALIHGVVIPSAARRAGKNYQHIQEIGGGYGKGERMALRNWREFITLLERLQSATGMSVGILGHAKLGKRKDVGAVDWDCWTPNIDPGAWNLLADWIDVFAFLGFEQGGTKDEKDPFARGKGFQTGKRFIYTARTATHYAGRRFPMPDRIEMIDPTVGDPWAPFAQAIEELTASENEILLAIAAELDNLEDQAIATTTREWLAAGTRTKDQLTRLLRKLRSK